jgi:hypothetical protein
MIAINNKQVIDVKVSREQAYTRCADALKELELVQVLPLPTVTPRLTD